MSMWNCRCFSCSMHDAAVAVHDRLRQPGGARGEQDPQRMVERHLLERGTRRRHAARSSRSSQSSRPAPRAAGDRRGSRYGSRSRARASAAPPRICCISGAAVERLAAVLVAVDAEQHLRRELREAVEHAARAEIRAAARPDGADAGGREHRDHGFGHVRQVRRRRDRRAARPARAAASRAMRTARAELVPGQARAAGCARSGSSSASAPGRSCAACARRS